MKKIVIVGAGTAGLTAAAMMKSYWGEKVDITLIYDKSRGNISVGDYQPIYDSEQVCKYVTKHIGKDVDYDIVFKSWNFSGIPITNTGAWLLENGFSIEARMCDLICNLLFPSLTVWEI